MDTTVLKTFSEVRTSDGVTFVLPYGGKREEINVLETFGSLVAFNVAIAECQKNPVALGL